MRFMYGHTVTSEFVTQQANSTPEKRESFRPQRMVNVAQLPQILGVGGRSARAGGDRLDSRERGLDALDGGKGAFVGHRAKA